MSNQYSLHKNNKIIHLNERDHSKSNNYFSNLNLVSPVLITTTKNFINYYYDHFNNEVFNVKNSAYYNQLTRSVNFLNNEVSNNWTKDIHALASINNWIFPNLSSSNYSLGNQSEDYLSLKGKSLHLLDDHSNTIINNSWNSFPKLYELSKSILNSEIKNEEGKKSLLTETFNNKNNINSSSSSSSKTFQYLKEEITHSFQELNEEKENQIIKKNAIKDLITINAIKNEEIIEVNLKKYYEKNFFNDCEKLKLRSRLELELESESEYNNHAISKIEEPKVKKRKVESEIKESVLEGKVEKVEDYLSRPNYVFGYGSLINPDSRGCTVDSTKSARVIKVLAKGLERSWNYNCRDTYTAVGVSKVENKSVACNGVIIPIDDPLNDLPKLDEREHDYRRVQLSREDIEIIHDSRNENIEDKELLAPNAIIWVYAIVDTFTPTVKIPISQIYIDCILMGCIKEGGIEFAKQFIENTHGWNTSVWVNDRTSEHFRKNISRCIIKLTDEIVTSIDSLLTTNLCIDVNKRIIPAY
ncbi:hypothetical protein H8356DRAFT_1633053 [Neocallimastix lanati (nom. inval.)]|nr:hypothetical protein H8356DRAFT_1633053 [Neocallimastix sp. JGI-2020a]